MKYSTIAAIVLDGDGVLWRSDTPLPGMVEMFEWMDERNLPYIIGSNNSTRTRREYVQKLERLGVPGVPEERIVTSATATAAYLQKHYPPNTPVHVFGMDGLRDTLAEACFDISGKRKAEVLVAGIDFEVTFERLTDAVRAVFAGADFIGTNPDLTFPSPDGLVPGAGSLLAAIEAATGVKPHIIGKPELPMFEAALDILGTPAEKTLMVGDRLNTDILGAQRAGMPTALVFTGVTTPEQLADSANDIWPDVAYDGLPQLISAWAGDAWYRERQKTKRC